MSRFDEENYWAAPQSGPPPQNLRPPGTPPPVWTWFVVYCVVMALFALIAVGMGVLVIFLPQIDPQADMEPELALLVGLFYLAIGLVFLVPYLLAPFLPKRP